MSFLRKSSKVTFGVGWSAEPDVERLRKSHELLSTNPSQALSELKDLAAQGSIMSMRYIAHAYRISTFGAPDLLEAERWLLLATDSNSVNAAYSLAVLLFNQGRCVEALKICKREILKSFSPALYLSGYIYRNGRGVPKNVNRARLLWERGAALGHLFSKRDLSFMLMSGEFGALQVIRGAWIWLAALIEMPLVALLVKPSSDRFMGIGEPKV